MILLFLNFLKYFLYIFPFFPPIDFNFYLFLSIINTIQINTNMIPKKLIIIRQSTSFTFFFLTITAGVVSGCWHHQNSEYLILRFNANICFLKLFRTNIFFHFYNFTVITD